MKGRSPRRPPERAIGLVVEYIVAFDVTRVRIPDCTLLIRVRPQLFRGVIVINLLSVKFKMTGFEIFRILRF
jgi:hypothetical protein